MSATACILATPEAICPLECTGKQSSGCKGNRHHTMAQRFLRSWDVFDDFVVFQTDPILVPACLAMCSERAIQIDKGDLYGWCLYNFEGRETSQHDSRV